MASLWEPFHTKCITERWSNNGEEETENCASNTISNAFNYFPFEINLEAEEDYPGFMHSP